MGERTLKAMRERLCFTLRDVEEITAGKISNAYLSQLENGKIGSPSLEIALALAATYGVSVEEVAKALRIPQPAMPPRCPTCHRALYDQVQS